MKKDIKQLEEAIGYTFNDPGYLTVALTHSSYANEIKAGRGADYERQEFLGDAVLELISSDHIFHNHPDMPEGDMTKLRASLVCEPALAHCARDIDLADYIRLGRGEESTGGRTKESIISDVMEAIIGGIYLDSGLDEAAKFVNRFIMSHADEIHAFYDAKSQLQQLAQANGQVVTYEVIGESGPDHAKVYKVACLIDGEQVSDGEGRSKKSAQQAAALDALRSGKCI
ncbi:ribonuclease-3 [Lachnospiraceae bacterium XBB2008]|nr:ribonuclease-3 [Lachnospiraceae bacterium XBB2008]